MPQRTVALRTLLLRSLLTVTGIAVVVLALPLAWYVQAANTAEVVAELEQAATRVVALAPDNATSLPAPQNPDISVGLYDAQGRLVAGTGPTSDADARSALSEGSTRVKHEDGVVAVYVPFDQEGGTRTTVRATIPESVPMSRTYRAWGLLLLVCLVAFAAAAALGLRRSRQLATPFERIAEAAHRMREGSLQVRVGRTGILEGDQVGRALEEASLAAAARVHRERELAQDANHQVRTPVAAARLTLESALSVPGSDLRAAAEGAVGQLDRASEAIDEVLALRNTATVTVAQRPGAAGTELAAAAARWRPVVEGRSRTMTTEVDAEAESLVVAADVLRDVLDVLLDNAVRHGRGTVALGARGAGGTLLVQVGDDGEVAQAVLDAGPFERGTTSRDDGSVGGLGLALARSLVEQAGGQLRLTSSSPTVFTVVLPPEDVDG